MKRLYLTALGLALTTGTSSAAMEVENVVLPQINLESLGSIGLVGEYDGISTYTYKGQQNMSSTQSSGSGDKLIGQSKDVLVPQQQLDGNVLDMCSIDDVVYFAGDFSKVGDTSAKQIASVNTTSGKVSALKSGPKNGSINAVYCDKDKHQVVVGGSFQFNKTQGVAVWDTKDEKWSSPLFGGFGNNSVIESINMFDDNLVFAGQFTRLFNTSYTKKHDDDDEKNGYKKIAKKQRVSFGAAKISAQGSADGSDPKTITCSNSKGWKLTNGRSGTWRADFPYYFTPTRMRLYNLQGDGDGVKHLRFRAFPLNGILNMTYVADGKNNTCNAECELPQQSSEDYVDYVLQNNVSMNSFQIEMLDFYGSAAGLGGIELFSSDIVAYAQSSLNTPQQCEDAGSGANSKMEGSGWTDTTVQQETYMHTEIADAAQLDQHSVTFQPNITVKGNYSVDLYTPGCVPDSTCEQRGQVNVSVYYDPDQDPISTVLSQTNNDQKFDTVYTGPVKPAKGDFTPHVEITPIAPQNVPMTFVAQRVEFNWVQSSDSSSLQKRADNDDDEEEEEEEEVIEGDEVDLNGLFEYKQDNFTSSQMGNDSYIPVGNTTLNSLLSSSSNVKVNKIVSVKNSLVIGGRFTSQAGESFAVVKDDKPVAVKGGGLNGQVDDIVSINSKAFVLGSFTATKDDSVKSSYVAIYDASSNKWTGVGNKFSKQPNSMAYLNINGTDAVAFSGPNKEFNVWVEKENKWLPDSSLNSTYVSGELTASLSMDKDNRLYAGSLRYLQDTAPGGVFLSKDFDLTPMPFKLKSDNGTDNATMVKREVEIQQSLTGKSINAGTFANKSTSILGGHFVAQTNDGESYSNLIIMDDDSVTTGLSSGDMSSKSVVYSLLVDDDSLYIGGDITNDDDSVGGLMFYNLESQELNKNQPPPLNGGQGIVTTLIKQPDSHNLVVMGSFEQAGSLGCNAFCVYDLKQSRWISPSGGGISGTVSSGIFIESEVMFFAGDMKLNGTKSYFAKYDFAHGSYESFEEMSKKLPGPVNSFVLNGDGDKSSSMFAAGLDSDSNAAYLAHWNDKEWKRLDGNFEKGSLITDLKLVELKNKHKDNDVLPGNQLLIVSGNLMLKDFGNVSSIMYDGKNWQPLFLTSNAQNSGIVNSLFSQTDQEFGSILGSQHMATGFVVLISLAIAVGLVLLLVALGLLVSYWKKRRQGYRPAPSRVSEVDMTETVPPANLFEEMGNVGTKRMR